MKDKQREEWIREKARELYEWGMYPRTLKEGQDFIRTLLNEAPMPLISKNWRPSAENINALPEPVRKYIYELETNADSPSMVRENIVLKENYKALEMTKRPKVSKAFIGKVTAQIYCDRRSVKAIKSRVRTGFEEAGVEVEK